MATDLSKFLRFAADGDDADITLVSSFKSIERFLEELEKRRVGPSGMISKLNTLCSSMSFVLHR